MFLRSHSLVFCSCMQTVKLFASVHDYDIKRIRVILVNHFKIRQWCAAGITGWIDDVGGMLGTGVFRNGLFGSVEM